MRWQPVTSLCVGEITMGSKSDGSNDDLAQLARVFADDILKPMVDRVGSSPAEIMQLTAEFRHKLEALDVLANSFPAAGRPAPANGTSAAHPPIAAPRHESDDDYDDMGRNQRSRIRELVLLETLSQGNRPHTLQQLMNALARKGFSDDSSGAVVSHLHRLKKSEIVDQPGNGMYAITDSGLVHLHRLRSSLGGLMS